MGFNIDDFDALRKFGTPGAEIDNTIQQIRNLLS